MIANPDYAPSTPDKADLIEGLTRGIAVIHAFDHESPQHSASSLAQKLGMSRAAARRFLITLEYMGLAATDGRAYWLTPKVMSLAQSYQSTEQLVRTVTPHLHDLMRQTGETVTFSVENDGDMLYLARATGPRLMNTNVGPGTRLPVQCTAGGWSLMAHWPTDIFAKWLKDHNLHAYTEHSITKKKDFEAQIARSRTQGFVLLENQFELGMRGISVAVLNSMRVPVGTITIMMSSSVCSLEDAEQRYVPHLVSAAKRLENYL